MDNKKLISQHPKIAKISIIKGVNANFWTTSILLQLLLPTLRIDKILPCHFYHLHWYPERYKTVVVGAICVILLLNCGSCEVMNLEFTTFIKFINKLRSKILTRTSAIFWLENSFSTTKVLLRNNTFNGFQKWIVPKTAEYRYFPYFLHFPHKFKKKRVFFFR